MNSKVNKEDDDPEHNWRRLALQFDNHRMQALAHLKMLLENPEDHRQEVENFLSAPPLGGEKVLEERIKDIAQKSLIKK